MGRRPLLASASIVGALVAAAPPCPADASPVSLDWQAPPACPSEGHVLAATAKLLAGIAAPRHVAATAKVERRADRWRVALSIANEESTAERTLEAESCAAAAEATAVILAIAADPGTPDAGSAEEASPAPGATSPAPAASVPAPASPASKAPEPAAAAPADDDDVDSDSPPPPAPAPAARRKALGLTAAAVAVGDVGTMPGPAAGLGLIAGYRLGWIRAEGELAAMPTQRATVDGSSRGGDFSMLAGDLRLCGVVTRGVVDVGPCAGVEIASMRAQGFGVLVPIDTGATWWSAMLGAYARVALGGAIGVRLAAAAVLPTARPEFELAGIGPVHRPAAIAARASLGVDVRF